MTGNELYLLGVFMPKEPGVYEGYSFIYKDIRVGRTEYKLSLEKDILSINNKRLFKVTKNVPRDVEIEVAYAETEEKGLIIVGRVEKMYFSLLFRDDMLVGWRSFDEHLLVCDGGGVRH